MAAAFSLRKLSTGLALTGALLAQPAWAETYYVDYGNLVATATVADTLLAGDNLFLDTFTTERGSLSQTTTFTIGSDVTGFNGLAGWIIDTADGQGPRLVGVNIDIFDSSNNLVASDSFTGVLGGFAHSAFDGLIGPGSYTLVATGNAVRDASLDISISLVPEPESYMLFMAGLGIVALWAQRRKSQGGP